MQDLDDLEACASDPEMLLVADMRGTRRPSLLTWACWARVRSLTLGQRLSHVKLTHRGRDLWPHDALLRFHHCLPKADTQPGLGTCSSALRFPLSPFTPSESFPVEFPEPALMNECFSSHQSAPVHKASLHGILCSGQPTPPPPLPIPRSEETSQPCGPG